jgi:hypothetical protein
VLQAWPSPQSELVVQPAVQVVALLHEHCSGAQIFPSGHWASPVQSLMSVRQTPHPKELPKGTQVPAVPLQSLCWWQQTGEGQVTSGHWSIGASAERQPR